MKHSRLNPPLWWGEECYTLRWKRLIIAMQHVIANRTAFSFATGIHYGWFRWATARQEAFGFDQWASIVACFNETVWNALNRKSGGSWSQENNYICSPMQQIHAWFLSFRFERWIPHLLFFFLWSSEGNTWRITSGVKWSRMVVIEFQDRVLQLKFLSFECLVLRFCFGAGSTQRWRKIW